MGVSVTFGELQERPIRRRRLDGEGLEHGAAQMAAVQRLVERVVVDHADRGPC